MDVILKILNIDATNEGQDLLRTRKLCHDDIDIHKERNELKKTIFVNNL